MPIKMATGGVTVVMDGNVLYLDCISVNILVVTIFARCYHWGKLGKEYTGTSLNHFLQLHVNL